MTLSFKVCQRLKGKLSTYILSKQLHKHVWIARTSRWTNVIVKGGPRYRLDRERDVLRHFQARTGLRQLLDEIDDPPSLVLKYLDDDLLSASNSKKLEKGEIKYVARRVLEALQALHREGYVHTDVKPDNVLISYGNENRRFREVELGDCGDVCVVDPVDHLKIGETGHVIGSHMFRSPEAMLNLRWGTPTDIWSFGAMLISLIWGSGFHIFKPHPDDAGPDDESYPNHVLVKQIAYFGPFPLSYSDILPKEDERWEFIGDATQYIMDNQKWKPFAQAEDEELSKADRAFVCKIMKLDPRDRPTAEELLKDEWLKEVESDEKPLREKLI